jgi:translocation and assembly module TamB
MKRFFTKLGRVRWRRWIGVPVLAAILLVIAFQAMVRTDWFQHKVRDRVVAELERASGGRAELGAFLFDPSRMTISITGLVVHGTEGPGDPPLLSVPSLRIELNLQSLLTTQVSLRALDVESPEVHITVAADGTTNLPGGIGGAASEEGVQSLLDLAVEHFSLRDGSVHWNNVPYRFSIRGQSLRLGTRYEQAEERYALSFRLGEFGVDFGQAEPLLSEAEGEVYIYRDRVEAPRLLLGAEGASLEAHGRVQGWQPPELDAEYKGHADVETWKDRLRLPFLGKGSAQFSGKLAWRRGAPGLTYSGNLEVESSLAGASSDAPRLRGGAEYSGDAGRARARNVDLAAFGGHFRGEGEIEIARAAAPGWRLAGDFDGYSIRSVIEALRRSEIAKIPPTPPWRSQLSGWLRAEGSGLDDTTLAASLILSAPQQVPPGDQPLEGVVDLAYRGRDQLLQFSRVDLSTNASRIAAHGSITADGRSILDLRVALDDFTDLVGAARIAGIETKELPVELQGELSVQGKLAGQLFLDRPPEAHFAGRIEANGFRAAGHDWRRFAGDVELDPDQLHLDRAVLEDRDGSAQIILQVPLDDYGLSATGPLGGNVRFDGFSLQRLLAALGRKEEFAGRLQGEIRLSGATESPVFDTQATVREGQAWDEPFERAAVTAHYAAGRVQVSGFEIVKSSRDASASGAGLQPAPDSARVQGQGEFTTADRRFRFDLQAENWRLQQFERFAKAPRPPSGDIQAELHASGRLSQGAELFEELDVTGNWKLQNVSLGDQALGSLSGSVATQGKQVHLDWQSDLLGGEVHGKADLQPAGDQSFQGQMEFVRVQAIDVAQLARLPVERLHGDVDGTLTFAGNLAKPNSLRAEGTINRLEAGLAGIGNTNQDYSLWNPFPMRWSLAEGRLHLDGMRLLGQGTDIAIDGTIPFALMEPVENKLDVSVEGDFNLSVLESFRSGIQTSGVSSVEVNIRGTLQQPQLRGRLQLRNASLRSDELPLGLNDMSGTMTFNGQRVRIDELKASSGGGTVRLTGTAVYEEGSASYRLSAEAQQVRVRYPSSMTSTVNGRLTFSGNDLQTLLTGEIIVQRLSTSPDANLGNMIAALGEPQRTPAGGRFLSNTQLNVRIGSIPDLPVQTTMFRNMQVEVDMRVVGTAVSPSLLGNISVTQGEMRFQGTRYVINRGEIDFTNPFRIEPVLDFELETRIRDVDIALNVSGPARNMNLSYRSDPPLEFNQLVSLIAVGRSPTTDPVLAAQERVEAQPLIQAGANTLLSQALSRPFSKGLQRFFGVSRLRVDPQVGGAETVPTARISTEQQITNDLTLIYSYNLADSEQQSVRVEWAPNRRLSFIVTRDENGLVGADVLYKKRLP